MHMLRDPEKRGIAPKNMNSWMKKLTKAPIFDNILSIDDK